jgi:hypothetical protein
MLKTLDIIMIMVIICAAATTFKIKADSETQLGQVRMLERQIAHEDETIDLLHADWSLLTQPSRIQKMVDAHNAELALQATVGRQIIDVKSIPEKNTTQPQMDPIADVIGNTGKAIGDNVYSAQENDAKPVDAETETGSIEQ